MNSDTRCLGRTPVRAARRCQPRNPRPQGWKAWLLLSSLDLGEFHLFSNLKKYALKYSSRNAVFREWLSPTLARPWNSPVNQAESARSICSGRHPGQLLTLALDGSGLIFNVIEMNNLHGSSFLSRFQYKRAVISDVKIPLFLEEMVSGYGYLRDTGYVLSVLFISNAQSASPEKLLRTSAEGECSAGLLWASPGMELESELRPKGEGCLQDWGCILCLSHDTCVLVYILTVKSIL